MVTFWEGGVEDEAGKRTNQKQKKQRLWGGEV